MPGCGSAGTVAHRHLTLVLPRAVRTAVEAPLHLGAVADHGAPTVLADRRQGVDGALETVEDVPVAGCGDLKTLVVVVAADLAGCHDGPLPGRLGTARPVRRYGRLTRPASRHRGAPGRTGSAG